MYITIRSWLLSLCKMRISAPRLVFPLCPDSFIITEHFTDYIKIKAMGSCLLQITKQNEDSSFVQIYYKVLLLESSYLSNAMCAFDYIWIIFTWKKTQLNALLSCLYACGDMINNKSGFSLCVMCNIRKSPFYELLLKFKASINRWVPVFLAYLIKKILFRMFLNFPNNLFCNGP